ncbi:MAG: hypothetical protein IJE48_00540 [Clostridia bacterium]|nr:hypothetical protein [Clostridia bacterium]
MNKKSVTSGFGTGCIIFAAAAIIALPLRVFHSFTLIEGTTGFYSDTDWSVTALYAVLVIAVLAILVFGFLKRKKLDFSLEAVKRPGLSWLSLIAACGILIDAYSSFTAFMSTDTDMITGKPESSGIVFLVQSIFAVLSAIYFIMLWLTYLKGKTSGSEIRLLALAPVIWNILRLVARFMRTISYIRVPELLFEMIAISFIILFFNSFAQVNAGLGEKNSEWKIGAYGLPAALMALICFIPRLVITLSGNTDLLYAQSSLQFCDLGIALFIIAAVLTRVTDRLPEENTETPKEQ